MMEQLETFEPSELSPYSNPYNRLLYLEVRVIQCRRCEGRKIDPEGSYDCLLCKGSGVERNSGGTKRYCSRHPNLELVTIGKRKVQWEDAMGFDQKGYLEVKGCLICKIPAYSEM